MTNRLSEAQTPTLGIEIEIPWRTMIRRVDPQAADILSDSPRGFYSISDAAQRELVQAAMNEVDSRYLGKITEANEAGIPKSGKDGFVEFALLPRDNTKDILSDVEKLYELDLLHDDEQYPLHVTIGGIAARSSVSYLLCSAEVIGDIRPERILQQGTWSMKCFGGMKTRHKDELALGKNSGVEFRTLEHNSLDQLAAILNISRLGAVAINSHPDIWKSWGYELGEHFRAAQLPTVELWRNSDRQAWERFADLLRDEGWKSEAKSIIHKHAVSVREKVDSLPVTPNN